MRIKLETDGTNIFVRTSRPLRDDEHVCLLRRGSSRVSDWKATLGTAHPKSRYRWHVYYRWKGINAKGRDEAIRYPWHLDDNGKFCFDAPSCLPYRWQIEYVDENGASIDTPPEDETTPHLASARGIWIKKAGASKFRFFPYIKDARWYAPMTGRRRICFGIAVYRELPFSPQSNAREIDGEKIQGGFKHKRVSNVEYFRSWAEVKSHTFQEEPLIMVRQWIEV